jgi:hypothetical protein
LKIERVQLKASLLAVAMLEYAGIPADEQIDHTFSPSFRKKARELNTKSQRKSWRCWNVYRRRIVLIAVIIAMLAALAACTPIIKKLYIEHFFVNHETYYGITFNQEQAAAAPRKIETYWTTTYTPSGYKLSGHQKTLGGLSYIWMTESGEYIIYDQYTIPANATSTSWFTVDAENTTREVAGICGYKVELFIDTNKRDFVAVWTDNAYLYTISISNSDPNKLDTVKAIMDSLVAVDPAEYTE